jgi:4-hydroxyacetophenone monooxygenase
MDPGGTWKENHYPGARVDIGGRFYCYSFEPSDQWDEYFPQHTELRRYFERALRTYGLESHCRFRARVDAVEFNPDTSRWTVSITNSDGNVEHLDARFVISAAGALNTPRLPDIEGAETFAGLSFHAARWDSSIDYSGSQFALVGAGASGFQIAPQIADEVARLTVYQRTAQWMLPSPHYRQAIPPRRPLGDAAPSVLRPLVSLPDFLPRIGPVDRRFTNRSDLFRWGTGGKSRQPRYARRTR